MALQSRAKRTALESHATGLEVHGLSYLLNTPEDQKAMLEKIGVASIEELFKNVPDSIRLKRPLQVPAALSELELEQQIGALAHKNRAADTAVCFLGGGSYDHFI